MREICLLWVESAKKSVQEKKEMNQQVQLIDAVFPIKKIGLDVDIISKTKVANMENRLGQFDPSEKRLEILLKEDKYNHILLAHEVGHFLDYAKGKGKYLIDDKLFDDFFQKVQETETFKERLALSNEQMDAQGFRDFYSYLNRSVEIFAQLFSQYIYTQSKVKFPKSQDFWFFDDNDFKELLPDFEKLLNEHYQ
jgi:hypothetical protein